MGEVISQQIRGENNSFAKQTSTSLSAKHPTLITLRKAAFTLAEVLITLGIIGIVAALTIPSLIQHHKKQEASAKLKKFYSMMSQAVMLSEAYNGPVKDWKRTYFVNDEEGNYDYEANGTISKTFFLKYLAPYIKYTKFEDAKAFLDNEGEKSGTNPNVYLNDGTRMELLNSGDCIDIRYDINGTNKPNKFGRDVFVFLLCNSGKTNDFNTGFNKKPFGPYYFGPDKTREVLMSKCIKNGVYCSSLLEIDDWEFKDDYPYKL